MKDFLSTQEFSDNIKGRIEAETWDKDKPMYYMRNGKIVEHWKDGTIKTIEYVEDAWAYQKTTRDIDGHNILGELRKLNEEI